MRTMDKKTFDNWVIKNFNECTNLMGYNANIKISEYHFEDYLYTSKIFGHFVIAKNDRKLTITNLHTNKHGSSFLKDGEDFDIVVGIGIAWARLKNEEIPVIDNSVVRISDLKYGDLFCFHKDATPYCFVATHPSIYDCFIVTTVPLGDLVNLRVRSSTQVTKIR